MLSSVKINGNSSYYYQNNNNQSNNPISNNDLQINTPKKNSNKEILIKNLPMSNKDADSIFRQHGLNAAYSTSENFHLYDISSLSNEFELPLEDSTILSFTNENNYQEYVLKGKYPDTDQTVNIRIMLAQYNSEEPMDEKTLTQNVTKAFKAIGKYLLIKNDLGDKQLDSYGITLRYDKVNKKIDFDAMKNSLTENIYLRAKHTFSKDYDGTMNLMVDKAKLAKAKQDLEDFFCKIFDEK